MRDSSYKESVTQRLSNEGRRLGVDPNVIIKRFAFQRLLARFATDPRWVLKGGYAMELRLGLHARTTKDLDLVVHGIQNGLTAVAVQDLIDEVLDQDLGDRVTFRVGLPKTATADGNAGETWRVVTRALLDNSEICSVRLDVMTNAVDMGDTADRLRVEPTLPELQGCEAVTIAAIDPNQQAAEKLHACARTYAHDRPSSRVKDLVDLVLLVEAGLLVSKRLGDALRRVFDARDGRLPPRSLPNPPDFWRTSYEQMAAELRLEASKYDDAIALISGTYQRALIHVPGDINSNGKE
ncbi:nucleotidyl transferase AbiEii/AbiGii toxin family protein [Actinomyces ruminis]|uniref:Nucleotidyl transferase AbiEii/AbiGii toxin family protein n=1 Tax=Actinomyces ruminis TaxID=1937003 RepID=A0ABX4MFW7_9ACTO|nr:nucleotidyl transferase AbiEii/AbiGii toxin family protein [Actinomyces ruminis]PHP53047.1 nucleotidyl transferase AbiEii/AbiGii toxin family protein [Actinomyces ruminis]